MHVQNTGAALAFQVHLKLIDGGSGAEFLPMYWQDNYFELLPGESRDIGVGFTPASGARALEAGGLERASMQVARGGRLRRRAPGEPRLRRALGLWDLVFYGIVLIQPVAPMGIYGVVSMEARGHVVTTILIGMVAMLLTAVSYGRMARAYPSAGSAFTYVGGELHPALGYATGWSMLMDYVLNPMICTIWCSKAAMNVVPGLPYPVWVVLFAALFTGAEPARRQGERPHERGADGWSWAPCSCCFSARRSATSSISIPDRRR